MTDQSPDLAAEVERLTQAIELLDATAMNEKLLSLGLPIGVEGIAALTAERDSLIGLLIECQVKLHGHVIHCGTDFERQCLEAIGESPDVSNIGLYSDRWARLKEARTLSQGSSP